MAGLTLSGVGRSFGRVEALAGIDLAVADGELVVVVGPSGCGKSTLLRLVAGLEPLTAGEIRIDGERVDHLPPARRGIAMVFQSYALYPHMTARQNIAFGLSLARAGRREIERRVAQTAEMLGISDLLDRRPRELSGGQRQRVAIGRAIVRQPRVFLFDEPLSNLDAALRAQMRAEIARLQDRLGATTVYVTHDQVEAMTLADRIVVLNAGRIEQVGAPLDLYDRPATRFVAGFIGMPQMNFLDMTVERVEGGAALCRLPGGSRLAVPLAGNSPNPDARVTLGIRPEHVVTGEGDLDATVELVEELGDAHHLHLVLPSGERLVARRPGSAGVRRGAALRVRPDPARCHLFDRDGRALGRGSG